MNQRAWSFKAVSQSDLRYYGNNGYQDDSISFYQYDNFVSNHKQVKKGDIVIITDRNTVIGISVIDNLSSEPYLKSHNRCPYDNCEPKKINLRKNKIPKWRCSNNHEFDTPKIEKISAIKFKAEYEKNFISINSISIRDLIYHTPRYNVQSSIQEVDLEWASGLFSGSTQLGPSEADVDNTPLDTDDQRKEVLRQIKQRRGQKIFRDTLLSQGKKCAVSGCEIVDILEAAHITAYKNDSHNHLSNGLLLRSDMHTLYDLDLFAINPDSLLIYFSPYIKDQEYVRYHGTKLHVGYKVNLIAIKERWERFTTKYGVI